jgi:phage repressor protein C with HTH and peptisase S24 domain
MEKYFSPIKRRILLYADNKGYSKRKIYLDTGISNGVLDKESGLTEDNIEKFISTYRDISVEWLITGNGKMLGHQDSAVRTATGEGKALNGIPLIPTSAMAGFFSGSSQILEFECERFVVPVFKDAEFLIQVKGSSMVPKYNSGDIVACKRMPIDTFFQWNKVYVLDTEQGALIKRIQKGETAETLSIVSDNHNYPPFELHRSKIYNIALVIGVIRLE